MRRRSLIAVGLIAGVLASAACTSQRAIPRIRESAARAMEQGRYELAASEYREILDRKPGDLESLAGLGIALVETGHPEQARDRLEAAHALDPDNQAVIDALARAMLESGELNEMIVFLRTLAEMEESPDGYLRLGRFLMEAGDLDKAETALLTAARLDGGQSEAPQLALARLYERIGDESRALERYRMALYVNPESEVAVKAIRSYGEIPGPTFALPPAELAGVDTTDN